jgi:hypothetical protein
MAQAIVDSARVSFDKGEFNSIEYDKRKIKCIVNETVTLVIKKTNNGITVMIKNASKYVTLTEDVLQFICNAHVSISYLCTLLEHQ